MKFSQLFQSRYESSFDDLSVDSSLQERIARLTFKKDRKDPMTMKRLVFRGAFAALGLFAAASMFSQNVFAQAVESVHNAFDTVVDAGTLMFTFTPDDGAVSADSLQFEINAVTNEDGTQTMRVENLETGAVGEVEVESDAANSTVTFTGSDEAGGLLVDVREE